MKKILPLLIYIAISPIVFAQKNSIQLTAVSYNSIPYSRIVYSRVNTGTALYYQRKVGARFQLSAGIYYLNQYLDDQSNNCFDCSGGEQDIRQLELSLAPKFYFFKKKRLLQPFVESGVLYTNILSKGTYQNYAWGFYHSSYELDTKSPGFYLRTGTDIQIHKNLFSSVNVYLSRVCAEGNLHQWDHVDNTFSFNRFSESIFQSGIEFRIGYRF